MRIFDLLQMSVNSLLKRKVRTLLTVLGVVIGTTSIVVMVSLGIGLRAGILEQIESYASLTTVSVSKKEFYDSSDTTSKSEKEKFLDEDLITTLKGIDHVVDVSPELQTDIILKSGMYICNFQLTGITQEALEGKNFEFASGEVPANNGDIELIYGNMVLEQFYIEKTGVSPYWEQGTLPKIDLMKDKMYVIYDTNAYWNTGSNNNTPGDNSTTGTTAKKPKRYITKTAGVLAGDPDTYTRDSYQIYCNIDALKDQLKRIFKKKPIPGQPVTKSGKPYNEIYYSMLDVEVDSMENVKEVTQIIADMGYNADNSAEWIESEMTQMNYIQAVLGAIGAVSLLVAAIGITNTMMMSIYERTKEIGVMKVLGCDMRNIQEMFLLEAGFIGFLGGAAGILLSYGFSFIINNLVGTSLGFAKISRIPLWLPLPAIGFAILIGMVAGFFPSLRAMRLSPLAAIRSE